MNMERLSPYCAGITVCSEPSGSIAGMSTITSKCFLKIGAIGIQFTVHGTLGHKKIVENNGFS